MTGIRIGYVMAEAVTVILFLIGGTYFVAGVLILEILLPLILKFLLALEISGMEVKMHTRSACRLGQTINIEVHVKSRWHCLATARIRAELFYENKMFQVTEKIPLALNIDKKEFSLSVPWKPQMCGGAALKISNISYYDIFGLNVIRKELHQMQQITVYPEKVSLRPISSNQQKGRQNEGQQVLSKRGYDATEVFDLREYQLGDSIRSIHWKLSEKFDTVLVREASDTSNYDILILFDAGCFSYGYKYGAEVLSAAVRCSCLCQ